MVSGKSGTDREEKINPERMREYRLGRIREQMNKYGWGALITWDGSTSQYVADSGGVNEDGFLIFVRNGDPYLYRNGTTYRVRILRGFFATLLNHDIHLLWALG